MLNGDCFFKFWIRQIRHVSVECPFFENFRNRVLTEGPSNKTPTLTCRCLQALAEALKINKSITNINLGGNQIGAEGAKAWCVVGSAECCGDLMEDVMSRTSCDSDKFEVWRCCSFIVHLWSSWVVSKLMCRCWIKRWISGLFFQVSTQRD